MQMVLCRAHASLDPFLWVNSTWIYEGLSTPPTLDISNKVHAPEQQEGEAAHTHHIRQRPAEKDHQQHFTATPTFDPVDMWTSLKC